MSKNLDIRLAAVTTFEYTFLPATMFEELAAAAPAADTIIPIADSSRNFEILVEEFIESNTLPCRN